MGMLFVLDRGKVDESSYDYDWENAQMIGVNKDCLNQSPQNISMVWLNIRSRELNAKSHPFYYPA